MKPYEQLIRIIYPQDGARIAIRTDNDWDTDVNAVGRNACISEFLIETERPYFYFKPVLISDDSVRWSRGENFLAVTTSNTPLKIHPYFREDAHCSVCELMPPLASPTGVAHRFRVFLPPGYHENTLNRNPVLYMHDGHNLFLKEEAFVGNTWRTDEVLNMLDKMNAIEETIVVGVFPHDRMNEYTKPGYEDYGRFLVEVLKPLVDKKISHARGPSEYRGHGFIARRGRFILSGMAMAEGVRQYCLPFQYFYLPGQSVGTRFHRAKAKNPDLSG